MRTITIIKTFAVSALMILCLDLSAGAQTSNQTRRSVQNVQRQRIKTQTDKTQNDKAGATDAQKAAIEDVFKNALSNAKKEASEQVSAAAAASKDLKAYLESSDYRSKENQSALVKCTSEDLKDLPKIIVNGEGAFILNNTLRDASSNKETFFGTDESVVYPGSLVYVNKSLANGDPRPCVFSPGKVRLTINKNIPGGKTYADVPNDYAHVHQQIVDWISRIGSSDNTYDAKGEISYYSNASHMAASLDVSASYLQNNVKVHMDTKTDELTIIKVENFSQNFYTVYATAIDNDPSTLIGSGTDAAKVKSGVNANGPIGMITSVTYGRRAYRFREFHSKDFTFNGDEKVSASGAGASGSAASTQNVTNSQKTSKFWAFIQSGNQSDKEIFNEPDATSEKSDFMQALNKASTYSASNLGIPMNFTVRFIGNSGVAKRAVTDKYYETEYVPCPKTVTIEMHKPASQVAGSSIEYKVHYQVIRVSKTASGAYTYQLINYPVNKKDQQKDTDPSCADYTRKKFSIGEGNATNVIPTKDVPNREDCYVYGNLIWTLRGNHSSGASWKTWDQGRLSVASLPDDPSGVGKKMVVYINGSNYSGKNPYIGSKSTGKGQN